MKLTKFALDRPVTVLMGFTAVVLIGIISWQRLSLELLPSVSYPQITVLTNYENVAPAEIESLISKPIEEAVGTIKGVRRISSVSKEGLSLVTLDFEWGIDTNLSALDVREKLDVALGALPKDVGNPILVKFDPASFPIVTLGISGPSDLEALARIASDDIKQNLERIPGVALARVRGSVERQILVSVDQGRLFAYGISIAAILEKLKAANFNFPGGSIEKGKAEIRIRTMGQFEALEDLENVVLSRTDQQIPIFLRDVATVTDTFKEQTSSFQINGEKSIGISIFKQADGNTVRIADEIMREVKVLQDELNPRVNLTVVYNQATFIEDAIFDLELAGALGGALAFLVLLLFLRSFQTALIVTSAIPISVLGVFTLMYMTGITLNIMSLGGLALGVGLLVDNGIVILENIHRHRKNNPDTYQAAISGATEMQNPVIASTLAHMVVFLPIIFVKGLAGKFFMQLALTISFSLLISILVALLLNPMLEAKRRFSQPPATKSGNTFASSMPTAGGASSATQTFRRVLHNVFEPFWRFTEILMQAAEQFYEKVLLIALKHPKNTLSITAMVVIGCISLLPLMGKEFIPNVEQGNFIIKLKLPIGTTLKVTEDVAAQVEAVVQKLPEVNDIFVNIGHDAIEKTERAFGDFEPNTAEMTVLLKEERRRSVEDMVDALRAEISKIKDVQTEFILNQNVGQMLKQKQEAPEILEISGPDFKMIQDITAKVLAELSKIECLKDVKSNLDEDETEIQVTVDREKAATYRLTVKNIADTLKTAIKGDVATQYYHADEETDIVVKLRKEDTEDMNQLEKILVHTPFNTTIPLSEVTKISMASRLREIQRRDLKRVSIIFANIVGVAFDDAVEKVRDRLEKIKLPSDYFFSLSDEQQEMNQSFKGLIFALGLSIILVYMLLASLFESFLNPFIIMFAVPLAAVGVILILFVFRIPISLGVFIGSIMLGGIVVNNSIILLDYTERLRKKGLSSMDAIVTAGRIRLRPILMTALTTILGLAPLASGFGGGSEIRQPLALTVIGGLSTSTFMTLVIIPVIYALFQEMKAKPTKTTQMPKIKPVKS